MIRMISHGLILVLGFLGLTSSALALEITEIMYNPEGSDTKREWIEVYNDEDINIDLTSYKLLENDVNHSLNHFKGAVELLPGNYAVIAADAATLSNDLSSSISLFDSVFTLNNTGEKIALVNDGDEIVDQVTYSSDVGANGDGNSLNLISGNWQPRSPTPGEEISTEVKQSDNSTSTGLNKVMDPYQPPKAQSTLGKIEVPQYGVAEQLINFEVHNPGHDYEYRWLFHDGQHDAGSKAQKIYELPGTYSVVLEAWGNNDTEDFSSIYQVTIEPPRFDLTTGVYKGDRYLRIKNKNLSKLELGGWKIVLGTDTYTMPEILDLQPDADYAFVVKSLNYPIMVFDNKGNTLTVVEKDNSAQAIPVSSNSASVSSPTFIPTKDGSVESDASNEEDLLIQEQLRQQFESYSETDRDSAVAPSSENTLSLTDTQLAAVDKAADFSPLRTIINVVMILVLGAGLALLIVSKQAAYRASAAAEAEKELRSASDYEMIVDDNDDF